MPKSKIKRDKLAAEVIKPTWTPDLQLPIELHEFFAHECLRTRDMGAAYVAAHWRALGTEPPNESHWGPGAYLAAQPLVAARIKYLKAEYLRVLKVSAADIAMELDQAAEMALMQKKPEVMISASMNKAKIFGIGEKGGPTGRSVGVMLVPTTGTADDWEKAAMAAQAALRNESSENPQ